MENIIRIVKKEWPKPKKHKKKFTACQPSLPPKD